MLLASAFRMAQVQDQDVLLRDQAMKEQTETLVKKANGTKQMDAVSTKAAQAATQGKAAASKAVKAKAPAATGRANGRSLAILYIAFAAAGLLFIGSVGPLAAPEHFGNDSTGTADALQEWSPLPQAALCALTLALLAAILVARRRNNSRAGELLMHVHHRLSTAVCMHPITYKLIITAPYGPQQHNRMIKVHRKRRHRVSGQLACSKTPKLNQQSGAGATACLAEHDAASAQLATPL